MTTRPFDGTLPRFRISIFRKRDEFSRRRRNTLLRNTGQYDSDGDDTMSKRGTSNVDVRTSHVKMRATSLCCRDDRRRYKGDEGRSCAWRHAGASPSLSHVRSLAHSAERAIWKLVAVTRHSTEQRCIAWHHREDRKKEGKFGFAINCTSLRYCCSENSKKENKKAMLHNISRGKKTFLYIKMTP